MDTELANFRQSEEKDSPKVAVHQQEDIFKGKDTHLTSDLEVIESESKRIRMMRHLLLQ